jgi:RHS repeat-associated protein
MLAQQSNQSSLWVHQDPVTKSRHLTDSSGGFVSAIELDPWGGETSRSINSSVTSQKYTSYERETNGSDYAMNRELNIWYTRFYQPDPFDGSYSLTNPQSFNRYSYVQNDPVNFIDPSGLMPNDCEYIDGHIVCYDASNTLHINTSAKLANDQLADRMFYLGSRFGGFTGGGGGGAGIGDPQNPTRDTKCDQKVAGIFGGEGAVSTASGFEPPNILNGVYRGDTTGDNGQPVFGHLGSRAMHLYGGDPPGTGTTGVYLPPGHTALYANPQTLPEYRGGSFVAFYPKLNGLQNVSIIATHVAGFTGSSSQRNAAGSIYIGTTGGRGASPNDNPNYIHSHFELVQGRVVRGRSTTKMPHISFNTFCK